MTLQRPPRHRCGRVSGRNGEASAEEVAARFLEAYGVFDDLRGLRGVRGGEVGTRSAFALRFELAQKARAGGWKLGVRDAVVRDVHARGGRPGRRDQAREVGEPVARDESDGAPEPARRSRSNEPTHGRAAPPINTACGRAEATVRVKPMNLRACGFHAALPTKTRRRPSSFAASTSATGARWSAAAIRT